MRLVDIKTPEHHTPAKKLPPLSNRPRAKSIEGNDRNDIFKQGWGPSLFADRSPMATPSLPIKVISWVGAEGGQNRTEVRLPWGRNLKTANRTKVTILFLR